MTQFDSMHAAAVAYVVRGWKIIPLHFIRPGTSRCSCDRPGCKAAGKHPQGKQWQLTGVLPEHWNSSGILSNIGILTGSPSGFWVLDYDPADAELGDLGARLHEEGYAPHVRTGGGGYHYRFLLPDDFEVRNRQSAGGGAGRTHSLPPGWDVRGEGGQVVAPPSVSAKGQYVELTGDWWLSHVPPGWLLDMIRPPDHMVSTAGRIEGLPQPGGLGSGSEHGAGEGSSHPAASVQAYATAALRAEIDTYSSLTDGRRGEAAFSFGCSLVEIANLAGWPHEQVWPHYEQALEWAAGNAGGGGYASHERLAQWERARAQVGSRAREMPPPPDVLPGVTSPFPPAPEPGAVDGMPTIIEPGWNGAASNGVNGVVPATGPMPVPEVLHPDEAKIREIVRARLLSREADRRIGEIDAAELPSLLDDLIAADALDSIPDPAPLVDGMLFADSLARLNGRPGQGKSFVAVDLAAHVASGRPWHGLAVRGGPVLYVAAEGLSGLKKRIRAWEARHDVKLGSQFLLFRRAVQAAGPEWARFVALATARRPALVVLDTQARVTAGLRENDSSEMSEFVEAIEALRSATGACVLVVHHKGKGDGEGGRGSNAVEGAMVSEFDVTKRSNQVTVKNTKQKDIDTGSKWEFTLIPQDESAVLEKELTIVEPGSDWKAQARRLYEVLRTHSGAAGITEAQAKKEAAASPEFSAGVSLRTASNYAGYAWNNLIMRGLVIRHNESKKFGVHVMEHVGDDGVLTPNVGEHQVADPPGWQTYAPDAIDDGADWSVNLGKTGGKRVSAAIDKMRDKT